MSTFHCTRSFNGSLSILRKTKKESQLLGVHISKQGALLQRSFRFHVDPFRLCCHLNSNLVGMEEIRSVYYMKGHSICWAFLRLLQKFPKYWVVQKKRALSRNELPATTNAKNCNNKRNILIS